MYAALEGQLIEEKDNVQPKEIVVYGIYSFIEDFMNMLTKLSYLCNKLTNAH
jgi:hypothetical protein